MTGNFMLDNPAYGANNPPDVPDLPEEAYCDECLQDIDPETDPVDWGDHWWWPCGRAVGTGHCQGGFRMATT